MASEGEKRSEAVQVGALSSLSESQRKDDRKYIHTDVWSIDVNHRQRAGGAEQGQEDWEHTGYG